METVKRNDLLTAMIAVGACRTHAQARHLVEAGAVFIEREKATLDDLRKPVPLNTYIRVGRRAHYLP